MHDDEYYMDLALAQARLALESGEVPVGAVLVDTAGRLLAQARNMQVHIVDPSAHAEILALREGARRMGNYRLTTATIYVTIEPCPMCAGALVHARIRRLVFGTADPKSGACGSLYNLVQDSRLNHCMDVAQGVRGRECREMIQAFFRERRKRAHRP